MGFSFYGANGAYECHGHHYITAWVSGAQSISSYRIGKFSICFKDKTKYEFEGAKVYLDGLLTKPQSVQVFYDSATITEATQKIRANIKFNPSFENTYSGMLSRTASWIGGGKKDKVNKITNRVGRVDDLIVSVYKYKEKPTETTDLQYEGHGSWLSHLIIDGKEMWRIEQEWEAWREFNDISNDFKVLESDSENRPDLKSMRQNEWDLAEDEKFAMEQLQRKDKANRLKAEKAKKLK